MKKRIMVISALLATCFLYGAEQRVWSGGGNGKASVSANWVGGNAPEEGDDIVFNDTSSADCEWDLALQLGSWTQTSGYTGTVTIATSFGNAGFTNLLIAGDCVINGGTWTHVVNPAGDTMVRRLRATIGGNFTVGAGGKIELMNKGFAVGNGPGKPLTGSGASYGGRAGVMGDWTAPACYGSVTRPYHLGSGGTSGRGWAGGGALWLEVGGVLTVDGLISANARGGAEYYTGSGGSIFCQAGELHGSGTIRASGGSVSNTGAGGGGRIGVVLTGSGADFTDWQGTFEAKGGGGANRSSPGTIYLEAAADTPGQGELLIQGEGAYPPFYNYGTELGASAPETNKFARLTMTGTGVRLLIHPNSLLDLSQCRVTSPNNKNNEVAITGGGIVKLGHQPAWSNAVLRLNAATSAIDYSGDTFTVASNGTLRIDKYWRADGDVVVANGGVISHTANGSAETYRLHMNVTGDLTIANGGAISVNGRGFSALNGPGRAANNNAGASHGGHGTDNIMANLGNGAYGSIYSPTNAGSGGNSSAGGGIVRLEIGGNLANNGAISANGGNASHYTGAGGSVWATAGAISGNGLFSANGGDVTGYTPGAGGRIAVTVTNSGATIDSFSGSFTAYGGALGSSNRDRIAGAGTVYLRNANEGEEDGTLIIDNNGMTTTQRWTPIIPAVTGRNFGRILIRDSGVLRLAGGETISVARGFANHNGNLLAEENSEVVLRGNETAVMEGAATFWRLICAQPGKTVKFTADAIVAIPDNGTFRMRGASGTDLELLPQPANAVWQLNIGTNAVQDIEFAAVSNSNASANNTVVANNSIDLGGNTNWIFLSVIPGETNIWTGAVDNKWGTAANWSRGRAPVVTDVVKIPGGKPFMPQLQTPVTINRLIVESGASLSLANYNLTITNHLSMAGALLATATETVTLQGDTSFAGGTVTPARSTLVVAGPSTQAIDFGGATFARIIIQRAGGTLNLSGGLTADEISGQAPGNNAHEYVFEPGKGINLSRLMLDGNPAATNLTLRSATTGSPWQLRATQYARVIGANVSDSNAGGGITVPAISSRDEGGNSNWNFSAKSGIWSGGGVAGKFDDADNWASRSVPDAETHVMLDNVATVNISAAAAMGSLVVGGGGSAVNLNAAAAVTIANSMLLLDQATASFSKPVVISNSFLLGNGAKLTHAENSAVEENKLFVTVLNDMTIEEEGVIDVRLKGHAAQKGYSPPATGHAVSHGGHGRNMNPGEGQYCYGSIASPTNIASGSSYDKGCGAVRLAIGGTLRHNGWITADGRGGSGGLIPNYYSGAGGSIWIKAGNLLGDGEISANGGNYLVNYPGGGGRISLMLTKSGSFSGFTGKVTAYGGRDVSSQTVKNPNSGAGTIYRITAAQREERGVVLLDNDGGLDAAVNCTDIPPAALCASNEFARYTFVVTNGATLRLRNNCSVGDVQIVQSNARLNLNGYTLTIRSRQHSFPAGTVINYGQIIWNPIPSATILMLR